MGHTHQWLQEELFFNVSGLGRFVRTPAAPFFFFFYPRGAGRKGPPAENPEPSQILLSLRNDASFLLPLSGPCSKNDHLQRESPRKEISTSQRPRVSCQGSYCTHPFMPAVECHRITNGLSAENLANWCVEPSQPRGIISGLQETFTEIHSSKNH